MKLFKYYSMNMKGLKDSFMRAAMLLLAVITTTMTVAAWERQPPVYHVDVCKGGIGEVIISGWVYDPYHGDISLDVVVSTAIEVEDDPEDLYEDIHSEWYPESTEFVYREDVNTAHNLTGNHGFRVKLNITDPNAPWFDEGAEKNLFVKIYARTYEYNENNPNCKDYEYLLNGPYTVVSVKKIFGYGTEEKPYIISNATDWNAVADVLADAGVASFYQGSYYQLANDEDESDEYDENYDNSTPVTKMWGTSTSPFTGHFDGKGKTVNVNISSTAQNVAPFAYVKEASIQDLTVTGTVSGSQYAGGIVGHAEGTLMMQRCIFDGTISGFKNFAGGLVGWCDNLTLYIYNCLFKGSFTPGSGGKYHPIALKNASSTVKAPAAAGVYYLNTAAPSAGLGDNIIIGGQGFPVSTTLEDGVWDDPVTAIDRQTYYAAHFTGKTLPYSYGFENDNLDEEGWTTVNPYPLQDGNLLSATRIYSFGCRTGSYSFLFATYSGAGVKGNQYLISPEFNGHSGIKVMFYCSTVAWKFKSKIQIGYSTTTNDVDAFTWDDAIIVEELSWIKIQTEFPKGTKFIAVKKHHEPNQLMVVDDFEFLICNTPSPTGLSVDDFTEHTASLSWEAPVADYPITGYAYQYKKASDAEWSDEYTTAGTSVTINGLAAFTDYEFHVKALYDEQDASDWLSASFTTATELPYECGFENGMKGWSLVDGYYITPDMQTVIQAEVAHDGENGFMFWGGLQVQYLISPRCASTAKIDVSFHYKDYSDPLAESEYFQVGYSTKTSNLSDFIWGSSITVTNSPWTKYENTFPEGTKYVAVRYNSTLAGDVTGDGKRKLYLDDFSFTEHLTSQQPKNLAVSNLTDQSAKLAWEAPNASVQSYAYQYKKASDDAWSGENSTTATSVTLSGLDANTTYNFQVKAVYSGGEASNYVTERFLTAGPAVTSLPFTEGFENGIGSWRIVEGIELTDIYSTSAENVHDGDNGFRFWPEKWHLYQRLISPQLDVQGAIKVSFYYKSTSTPKGLFQVAYSTTADNPSDRSNYHWYPLCESSDEWQQYTVYCPEGTKYVAVVWCGLGNLYLDDFTFEPASVTPTEIQDITVDATATSAEISWTGGAEDFEVRYRKKASFFYDFEDGFGKKEWTSYDATHQLINSRISTTWQCWKNNGNQMAVSINHCTTIDDNTNTVIKEESINVDSWLCLPKRPLTGTLTFEAHFYRRSDDCDENDRGEVIVFTDFSTDIVLHDDFSSVTVLGTINPTHSDTYEANFYRFSLDRFNGQEGYIAFRHKSVHNSWFDIDDVSIYDTTDEWTTLSTQEHHILLTGLEPHAGYEYQVRTLASSNSKWSDIGTFTAESYIHVADGSDIDGVADGNKHDVILQGYTLCPDREWNTLCLPFDVADGDETDGITFSGTPLQGATVKELDESSFSDGTLTMTFTEVTGIEAGKPYIVKWPNGYNLLIRTEYEWKNFAQRVADGETFAGMNVSLADDISVSTMAGTAEHPFCGTFDGNGYTLNVNIDDSGADYAAPFRYINGATIRNVKVTGSVKGGDYCSGLVGAALGGTNSIRNCWMAASVSSQENVGGVLGHGTTSATTISNCYLTGSLNGGAIGVFCGGGSDGGTFTAETCWANGAYNVNGGGINLVRTDGGTVGVTNCRHNDDRIAQGSYNYNTLVIVLVIGDGSYDSQYVTFLGNQWGLNGKGELIINPSAEMPSANIQDPLFEGVTVSSNDPTPVSFSCGEFEGTYSPFANTSDRLFDVHNTGNEAFHAAYSYDRASLGEGFVDWYNDAALTSPATVLPFDADGNVTLYAGMMVELADDSDNSGTIGSVVSSGTQKDRVVVLNDRTLHRNDDWNTLCLPFSMSEAQIASSPLAGVTIMELDGTTSNLSNGTLTLNFKVTYGIEAGRPYIVRWQHPDVVINSTSDWNDFAEEVNNGTSYAGQLVQLGDDIDVSTMVGTEANPFCGIFDGNGYTLNVSISGAEYAAPFRCINGATIRNVKVTGSVSGGQYSSGLVGKATGGQNFIRNCWMAASVTSLGNNIGGVLGHGTTSFTTISNCFLTGTLSANDIGVFCGRGSNGGTFVLETCWEVGTYNKSVNAGSLNLILTDSGATVSITNSFHNDEIIAQGIHYGLFIVIGGSTDYRYRDFLGCQWTLDDSGYLKLKPSIEFDYSPIQDPVFTGVTISDAAVPVETSYFDFVGITSPLAISGEDRTKLYLGAASTLYYPNAAMTINACRAYFQLKNGITVGDPGSGANAIRSLVLNFGGDATEIESVNHEPLTNNQVYDLAGRRINGVPSEKGIYIVDGKKVIVK